MRLKVLGGLLALTVTTAVLLLGLVGGAAGGHGKGKGHNKSGPHGRIGYHFVVLDQIAGSPDRLIVQGDGSFNRNRASGGGIFEGGVLVIHATLKPIGKPAIKNVMIEIDCNLGPAGFSTGKPEGIVVTIPGGPTFTPTSPTTGNTIFSLNKGHKH